MIETYRMLGAEHQTDLDREAGRRSLARAAPRRRSVPGALRATLRHVVALRLRTPPAASPAEGGGEA